ncbi:N-acetyltransferase [Acinetobacter sp. ASP199]|uniref:N-acetyltransferase n=1 Tax=unclassified Acinetobacter TaxID=196816 RepID=UPI001F6119D3|nr:N-acetyltransferase [Acinetobacter sp. ASP199]UNT60013.1 N-acetyltransferase [Acinetobacter sp. ASP199]
MIIIQKAETEDIHPILDIWLNASLQAHAFIPAIYWEQQLLPMHDLYLPLAENYVIKENHTVQGFASLLRSEQVLAALFIHPDQQGKGYGARLLDFLKQQCEQLHLNVYTANTPAVHFYQKHGFKMIHQGIDHNTGQAELSMSWFKS